MTSVKAFDWLLTVASRRSIRTRSDLWRYVLRMTGYISVLTMLVTSVQARQQSGEDLLFTCLGAGLITVVLALPITWEFGQMYLDLWRSTQALRDLAAKDQQTGLLNHRSFIAAAEDRLYARRPIALLIGDLDRFKTINDRHGHLVGDEVIARVGAVLRDLFGDAAVLGRMGGEEYAVIVECPFADPEIAHAQAEALAEEMLRRVAEIAVPTARETVRPTMSAGVAWSRPGSTFADLYSRADKALYVAKAAGRNRIVPEYEIDAVDPEQMLARRQDLYWRETNRVTVDVDGIDVACA